MKIIRILLAMIFVLICGPRAFSDGDTSSTGAVSVGNRGAQSMNPDISVILDGVAGFWQRKPTSLAGDDPALDGDSSTRGGGFTIQEAEVGFSAAIDPMWKGDLFLTIPNQGKLEIEEGYVTSLDLPYNLQLKGGKFRSSFGRQNGQHLHLQDFTRRPLINQQFLGVDGLSAPGAQLSILLPMDTYAMLALEALSQDPTDDSTAPMQSFGGGGKKELTSVATFKTFLPFGDDISIYAGASYARGVSSTVVNTNTNLKPPGDNLRTQVYGLDLYAKFKPANASRGFQSLSWQTEYIQRRVDGNESTRAQSDGGLYTQLVYQIARPWFLGVRYDWLGLPVSDYVKPVRRISSSLTYAASEFSRVRVYLENETASDSDFAGLSPQSSVAGFLQLEISLGAHGAHPF